MKFATLELNLENLSRDAVRQFGSLLRGGDQTDPPRVPAVTKIADDPYSEAINFRFVVRGATHRGLTTYDALLARYQLADMREEPLALFVRHAGAIAEAAAEKQSHDRAEVVVLENGDL
jgi:hypothetical protein